MWQRRREGGEEEKRDEEKRDEDLGIGRILKMGTRPAAESGRTE